jgi:NAD(P)-dependent dehydrogenase (short-subunit alcohol dehydrogenase family)
MCKKIPGGKMKIITGASSGIGKYLLERYLMGGEVVHGTSFLTGPRVDLLKYYYRLDICDYAQVEEWIGSIPFERPNNGESYDVDLINCAAINYNRFAGEAEAAFWERVIRVNLVGTFNVIRAVLPRMIRNGYGRIINMSSVVDSLGVPGTSAYAASKAGLEGLTKVLAVENGCYGITVNNLRLGYFDIGMGREIHRTRRELIEKRIPTHKFGNPETILNAVNFLIDNPYINGSTMTIDGGLT